MRRHIRFGLALVVCGGATAPRLAVAAPCSSIGAQPIVYVESGDTQEGLLKRLGSRLVNAASPIRIVYKSLPTCTLGADLYNGNPMVTDLTGARPIRYIPSSAEDPGWNPNLPAPICEADAPGNTIGLGIGATYLSSCTALPAKPADVAVLEGPEQAYGFIAPIASNQIAITAEEGYLAYGFPAGDGQALPWVEQALRFSRGATASTALTTASAIGLKAGQLKGTIPPNNTSTEVLNLVATSTNPNATIGIMGADVYDSARNQVKMLAFKGFGQRYAYFPDSTGTSFDKQNMRDGHYLPWSPTPYITRVDGAGKATDPNVQRIIDLVFGARTDADVDGLLAVIQSGLVPKCAMKVQRLFDGGDLSLYDAPEPCGCYYEANVPQGTTKCTACANDTVCGGGKCRRGYCEAR
ncbi:MAG: hypothetical protein JST00_13805 [Deltaproteobacteria bacterium]|nr:hypothetical protein [Deltaproteobacteria bacterium]